MGRAEVDREEDEGETEDVDGVWTDSQGGVALAEPHGELLQQFL